MVAGLLVAGHSIEEILELYPCLEREDVEAVREYELSGALRNIEDQPRPEPGGEALSPALPPDGLEPVSHARLRLDTEGVIRETLALPDAEQEYVLSEIISSIEKEGGVADGDIERYRSWLAGLKASRAVRRGEAARATDEPGLDPPPGPSGCAR